MFFQDLTRRGDLFLHLRPEAPACEILAIEERDKSRLWGPVFGMKG